MNKASKFRCGDCNTTWNTKRTYALHMSMCQFIHHSARERAEDKDMNQLEMPSPVVMFHYILHLTQKYEDLEKKWSGYNRQPHGPGGKTSKTTWHP